MFCILLANLRKWVKMPYNLLKVIKMFLRKDVCLIAVRCILRVCLPVCFPGCLPGGWSTGKRLQGCTENIWDEAGTVILRLHQVFRHVLACGLPFADLGRGYVYYGRVYYLDMVHAAEVFEADASRVGIDA